MDRDTNTEENTMSQTEQQTRTTEAEDRTYRNLQTALLRARKLLDQTEAWAEAWHTGALSNQAPFGLDGGFYAADLTSVALTAQRYKADAEMKALVDSTQPTQHEAEEAADAARVGETDVNGLTYQGNGTWTRVD